MNVTLSLIMHDESYPSRPGRPRRGGLLWSRALRAAPAGAAFSGSNIGKSVIQELFHSMCDSP